MRGRSLISILLALLLARCGNGSVKQAPLKPSASLQDDSDRTDYRQKLKIYKDSLAIMSSMVELTVISAAPEVVDGDTTINFTYRVENKSPAQIIGFEGFISVKDIFEHEIEEFYVEQEKKIDPGQVLTDVETDAFEGGSYGSHKIMSTAFNRLTFIWTPDQIVFADGKHIKCPDKPTNPDEPTEHE